MGNTSGNSPVPNLPAGSVAIGVVVEPLLAWLWAGGLLVGLGGLLALVPGSRRRATDPVSAPSDMVNGSALVHEPAMHTDGSPPAENAETVENAVPVESAVTVDGAVPSA